MRRASVVRKSRSAAPSREVTTPIARGNGGSGRLRCGSNSPSAWSFVFSRSNASNSVPSPARRSVSTLSWNWPRGS